ncbi:MAG: hypothetical protein ACOYJB_07680 [Christensenellaceae bacterium]
MARIESLNVLLDTTGKDYLAELYGKVIQNIQKAAVSSAIKNTDLSGNPEAGTVEAKRFVNATSKAYGTARQAAKGDYLKARPVTIAIDKNKEIVEELEDKDAAFYGVEGLLVNRAQNHVMTMTRELEQAFFTEAVSSGAEFTTSETEAEKVLEEAIQALECVKNDYVDGVPRDMIHVVASPKFYGKIRTYIDQVASNANVDTAAESINAFHGVRIDSSIYLPADTEFVVMAKGSVAQPVRPKPYAAEKIPLSEAYAVELFFYYGTKAVMPDLIFYKEEA